MLKQNCGIHREREATLRCTVCERWYCNDCLIAESGGYYCRSLPCRKQFISLVKKRIFLKPKPEPDLKSLKFINRTAISFTFFSFMNILLVFLNPAGGQSQSIPNTEMLLSMSGINDFMTPLEQLYSFLTLISSIDIVFGVFSLPVSLLLLTRRKFARILFVLSLYFGLYFILTVYFITSMLIGNLLRTIGSNIISTSIQNNIQTGHLIFSFFLIIPVFAFTWLIIRLSMSPVRGQFY